MQLLCSSMSGVYQALIVCLKIKHCDIKEFELTRY